MPTVHSDTPKIPGYRPIPLIGGRANLLRFFSDPIGHLLGLERRYGSVAALTAGDPSFVCAFGAAHNHAVLSDHDRMWARPAGRKCGAR